jgi:hypothetical protein
MLEEILKAIKALRPSKHTVTIVDSKTCASAGAEGADDVVSDSTSVGKYWSWNFGGSGKIVKAVMNSATNAITPTSKMQLYSKPPTCNLNDNVPATSPNAADTPYHIGDIDFPALTDSGTGASSVSVTPSTLGGLPITHDVPMVYGVLITKDSATWAAALITVKLSSEMDN